jgi:hypothetical protein
MLRILPFFSGSCLKTEGFKQLYYQIQNIADGASLRLMPYLEISRSLNNWFYAGFGLGYRYNNIYFGMRPQLPPLIFQIELIAGLLP